MKCVKGYLIENSQSGKRVIQNEESNLGMRSIEFLLPNQSTIYNNLTTNTNMPNMVTSTTNTTAPTSEDTPQEIEYTFQQFRGLLVNLFRTS